MSAAPPPPYAQALVAARAPDGGFGPRAGQPSEPEPTALAAIALDDEGARGWLEAHQRADGTLRLGLGAVENDSATALAALALSGPARERALDAIADLRAAAFASSAALPFDERYPGWPWTEDAFGWTEPTSRALLAMRVARPQATAVIEDGLATLHDRECAGGGWNYGNRVVLDEDLPPYAQTTAVATMALQVLRDREPGDDGPGAHDRGAS